MGIAYMVRVLSGQNWPFKRLSVYQDNFIIESDIRGQTRHGQKIHEQIPIKEHSTCIHEHYVEYLCNCVYNNMISGSEL